MTRKSHTGVEQDIFPHLAKRKLAIIAYTATRWRGLLKRPKDWSGPVMTASDCYRFGIEEQNRSMASRLIRDASKTHAIVPYDPTAAPKLMKYVPWWAAPEQGYG